MLNILIDPSNERKIVDFRQMGFQDVMVVGRHSYTYAHDPLQAHTHGNMLEICYLDTGSQPYISEGREYTLKGGDVFVNLPYEIHGSGKSPLTRGRLYWMLIRVPSNRERFLNLTPAEGQEIIQGFLNLQWRQFKGRRMLKFYLENIFRVHDTQEIPFRTPELKNWMLRFLLDVLADAERHSETCISSPIVNVIKFIEDHLDEEAPMVDSLADMVNLSLSRFKVRFKEEVGVSPGCYIAMRKVEKAKELLGSTKMPITTIAHELSFTSSQYFATVFKRHLGITPTQFRENKAY